MLFVFKYAQGIDDKSRGAEQSAQYVVWEEANCLAQEGGVVVAHEKLHGRKDQDAPPLVLFHEVTNKSHGNGAQSPYEPAFVEPEDAPAIYVERNLHQVDERLAYQEEHKAFERRVHGAFAVHDDDYAE